MKRIYYLGSISPNFVHVSLVIGMFLQVYACCTNLPSSPTVATANSLESPTCFTSTESKLDRVKPGKDVTVVVPSSVGVKTARPVDPGTEVTEKVAREVLEMACESRTCANAVAVAQDVPLTSDVSACKVGFSPRSMTKVCGFLISHRK